MSFLSLFFFDAIQGNPKISGVVVSRNLHADGEGSPPLFYVHPPGIIY